MRNAPIGLLILMLFCTSAPRPATLADVKTRAIRAGYTRDLQALADTARDTLSWFKSLPKDRQSKLRVGLTAERGAEVLAAWHKRA